MELRVKRGGSHAPFRHRFQSASLCFDRSAFQYLAQIAVLNDKLKEVIGQLTITRKDEVKP